jgi:hypothetical protein
VNTEDEEIVASFFGETSRARELRELKETLQERLKVLLADGSGSEKKIQELRGQISVLAEEEAVSGFVEESVRATLARPEASGDLGPDDDGGPY